MHGCPPLAFDSALARSAQKWAEDLAGTQCMRHSDQTTYGENLAFMGITSEIFFSGADASKMWYMQSEFHDYNGEMTYESCYFTQMIWKDTKIVGFGQATSQDGYASYIVAHYMPKGNVRGQFSFNVPPARLDAFAEQYDPFHSPITQTLPAVSQPTTPTVLPSLPETKEERKAREKAEKKERERMERERKETEKREKKARKELEKIEKKEKRKSLKL
ncbi:Golgi-associated plant pathogenesis protein 1 [Fasciola hepatica]|nr:Golgi-associated plant pathogenesis protein 1 [Fasciola hepatica]